MDETHQPVVIYDGECRFCRQQIDRIRGWDRLGRFEFVPKQTPGLDDRFPVLSQSDFNTGMRLIDPSGVLYVGADAVYQIFRRLPGWWMVAWVYRVPVLHGLFGWLYGRVAARRQSLGRSCDDGACRIENR